MTKIQPPKHSIARWCRPQRNTVKLNVDAACDMNSGLTGLGAIIRDDKGSFLSAVMDVLPGQLSVFAAGARAILTGLRCCLKDGFKRIEVESDALDVIKAIEAHSWDFSPEGPIFDEIESIAVQVEVISWKHIPRNSNSVAHALARAAFAGIGLVCWKGLGPPWLEKLVIDDSSC